MKLRTKPNTSRHQTGFTLVELMVSITIGLFLLAAMGGIYFSSSRIFSATGATTAMDENARAIFDLIGVNVRQAGFNGCANFSGTTVGDIRGVVNGWNNDIANPVQGLTLTASDSRFPGSLPGTDVLMLVGVDSQRDVSVISDDGTTIVTGAHDFQPREVLLASGCQLNGFFVMSSGTTTTIVHGSADNCEVDIGTNCTGVIGPLSAVPIPDTLPPGALIMPVVANAYFIADSGASGKGRSLWSCTTPTDCREMANGVENLKLSFALDTTGNGSIDRYVSADTPIDWSQVRAVKLNLLLATLPDSGASSTGSNEYTFNGETVTPDDRRIYREYTTVFSLRNKTL
ncbi:MAG: PilW family protein [Burkholderiales bacterium]|jgi:type IV pilus assembly protein PilW|nr:PilW family protein [Burkholderiales bacterium]